METIEINYSVQAEEKMAARSPSSMSNLRFCLAVHNADECIATFYFMGGQKKYVEKEVKRILSAFQIPVTAKVHVASEIGVYAGFCWYHETGYEMAHAKREALACARCTQEIEQGVSFENPGGVHGWEKMRRVRYHPDDLTLDNYLAKTGRRFRMSKPDVDNGVSREQAFENHIESLRVKHGSE